MFFFVVWIDFIRIMLICAASLHAVVRSENYQQVGFYLPVVSCGYPVLFLPAHLRSPLVSAPVCPRKPETDPASVV